MKNNVHLKKKKQREKKKISFFTKTLMQMVGALGLYIVIGLIMLFSNNKDAEDFIRRQLFCSTDFKSEIISVFNKINSSAGTKTLPVINNIGGIDD